MKEKIQLLSTFKNSENMPPGSEILSEENIQGITSKSYQNLARNKYLLSGREKHIPKYSDKHTN